MELNRRNFIDIKEFILNDKEISEKLNNNNILIFENLSQKLFNKNYEDLTKNDFYNISEEILKNIYFFKKNMPADFSDLIGLIFAHKNSSFVVKNVF